VSVVYLNVAEIEVFFGYTSFAASSAAELQLVESSQTLQSIAISAVSVAVMELEYYLIFALM
jgi:hypothetical protein